MTLRIEASRALVEARIRQSDEPGWVPTRASHHFPTGWATPLFIPEAHGNDTLKEQIQLVTIVYEPYPRRAHLLLEVGGDFFPLPVRTFLVFWLEETSLLLDAVELFLMAGECKEQTLSLIYRQLQKQRGEE